MQNKYQEMQNNYRLRMIALIAIFLSLAFMSAVIAVSAFPQYCGLCHSKEQSSHAKRIHKKIPCSGCHSMPGTLGMLSYKTEMFRMLFSAAMLKPVKEADIPSKSCLYCHKDVLRGIVKGKRIIMSHLEPFNEEIPCMRCHGNTGHVSQRISGILTMDICLECHGSFQQSCGLCHISRPKMVISKADPKTLFDVTHGEKLEDLHGAGDLDTCNTCHLPGTCKRCHETDLPHNKTSWPNLHGKEATANKQSCLKCHGQKECDACHGLEMPHTKEFAVKHKNWVDDKGEKFCLRCHVDTYCNRCHLASTHFFTGKKLIPAEGERMIFKF